MIQEKVLLRAFLAMNSITHEMSRIVNFDNNDAVKKSEYMEYLKRHSAFLKIKNQFQDEGIYESFLLTVFHQMWVLRNKYWHKYDEKYEDVHEQEIRRKKFKMISRKKEPSEEHNPERDFETIIKEYVLTNSDAIIHFENDPSSENFDLLILKMFSSKYLIDRVRKNKNLFKMSETESGILFSQNVSYIDLFKYKKFEKPKPTLLSSILFSIINDQEISKILILKSMQELFNKKVEAKKYSLVEYGDKKFNPEKIMIEYTKTIPGTDSQVNENHKNDTEIEKQEKDKIYTHLLGNTGKKVLNNKIFISKNFSILELKSKKQKHFLLKYHDLMKLIIWCHLKKWDKNQIISLVERTIGVSPEPKIEKVLIDKKYEIFKNQIEFVEKADSLNGKIRVVEILLKKIWKYEVNFNGFTENKKQVKTSPMANYMLNAISKRKLCRLIASTPDKNDNLDKFISPLSEIYEGKIFDFESKNDISIYNQFKKNFFDNFKSKELFKENKKNENRSVFFIFSDKNSKEKKIPFLRIKCDTPEIKNWLKSEGFDFNKNKKYKNLDLKEYFVKKVLIPDLQTVTPNLPESLVNDLKLKDEDLYKSIDPKKYRGKNNKVEKNPNLNSSIVETDLFQSFYKVTEDWNDSLKRYLEFEYDEIKLMEYYLRHPKSETNNSKNIFAHRCISNKEEWDEFIKNKQSILEEKN